jgi:hypothetical protein
MTPADLLNAQAGMQRNQLLGLQLQEGRQAQEERNSLRSLIAQPDAFGADGAPSPTLLRDVAQTGNFAAHNTLVNQAAALQQKAALAAQEKARAEEQESLMMERYGKAIDASHGRALMQYKLLQQKGLPDDLAKQAAQLTWNKEVDAASKSGAWGKLAAQAPREFDPVAFEAYATKYHDFLAKQTADTNRQAAEERFNAAEEGRNRRQEIGLNAIANRMAARSGGNASATPIGDDTKTGAEYLASLPKDQAALVQGLAEGRVRIESFSTRGGHREKMLASVMQFDPTYNATRANSWREFTTGATAKNITSINTSLQHMDAMYDLAGAMKNKDTRLVNLALNHLATQTGRSDVTNFETARQAVSDELMRTFRQVGASETEVKDWQSRFNSSGSPEQLQGAIKTAGKLLQGRIGALNDQWKRGTQLTTDFPDIVSPQNQKVMEKIGAPFKKPGAAAGAGLAKVASDADYEALPSGTEFLDPAGARRRKP